MLHASHENIKRAERKFDDLKGAINRFIDSRPYSVSVERKDGITYVLAREDRGLPEDIPWDTVDVTQRLRIALDKAIIDVVEQNGRGTSSVGYPFGGIDRSTGKPNPFPDGRMLGKGGIKEKLTSDQWRVVEAQKPYPGGNDSLWAINEIANTDKHRKGLVEVVPRLGSGLNINAIGPSGTAQSIINMPDKRHTPFAHDERITVLLSLDGARNLRVEQKPFLEVVFGSLMPVTGKNVLVALNEQIRLVKHMINEFRPFLR
jgi:hypothetical protein